MDERDDTGDLKYIRGKSLPVKVSDKCSAAELKEAAIDQEFCALEDYVLLYPDFKEVFYLPRSLNVFQLDKYKHDLAKPYSQILFYLCMLLHFEKGQPSSGKTNLSPKKPEFPSAKEGDVFLFDELSNFYRNLEIFQYHLATVLLFHQVTHQPPHSIWYIKHHLGTLTKNY